MYLMVLPAIPGIVFVRMEAVIGKSATPIRDSCMRTLWSSSLTTALSSVSDIVTSIHTLERKREQVLIGMKLLSDSDSYVCMRRGRSFNRLLVTAMRVGEVVIGMKSSGMC